MLVWDTETMNDSQEVTEKATKKNHRMCLSLDLDKIEERRLKNDVAR
jgi:hypothetical protein